MACGLLLLFLPEKRLSPVASAGGGGMMVVVMIEWGKRKETRA